jgi:hypothetical protein
MIKLRFEYTNRQMRVVLYKEEEPQFIGTAIEAHKWLIEHNYRYVVGTNGIWQN